MGSAGVASARCWRRTRSQGLQHRRSSTGCTSDRACHRDIMATLEKLGALKANGILTQLFDRRANSRSAAQAQVCLYHRQRQCAASPEAAQ
jgi:hypothetical protein